MSILLSAKDAAQFLAGTHTDKSLRIEEFIMMYPLPGSLGHVEEIHNARGIGIKVSPGDWFE